MKLLLIVDLAEICGVSTSTVPQKFVTRKKNESNNLKSENSTYKSHHPHTPKIQRHGQSIWMIFGIMKRGIKPKKTHIILQFRNAILSFAYLSSSTNLVTNRAL